MLRRHKMLRTCLMAALALTLQFGTPQLLADATTEAAPATAPATTAAPATTEASVAAPASAPTLTADKTSLDNGGVITLSGKAAPGKPVFIEVYNEHHVKGNFFDSKPGKDGKIPYKLYISNEMPAFYQILLPTTAKDVMEKFKKEGKGWSYGGMLKETGADAAYITPGKTRIEGFQTSLMASLTGSRGTALPELDDKDRVQRSKQIMKSRYGSVGKLFAASVEQKEDGSFTATVKIPDGSAPGNYVITAATDKASRSDPVSVENKIAFPVLYMENAGTSLNLFVPFFLTLAIATLGVLCGFGGAFILNPVLIMGFGIPHPIVAGTVMPTILFSQGSGIWNYAKIKFISWKVGLLMGAAMLAGGFIGPALTLLVTLDQFKSILGWILFIVAGLMVWQTTPGYMAKNKKEQAILKEFQKRAKETAAAKKA